MIKRPRKIQARGGRYLDPATFVDVEIADDGGLSVESVNGPRRTTASLQPAAPPDAPLPPALINPDLLAPALMGEPEGSPARKLLDMIYNKWAPGKPLAFFCEEAGLEFTELVEKVERHYSGLARINATRHYVEIFEDTAIDAKARVGLCDRCFGEGWAQVEFEGAMMRTDKVCPYCEGTGHRRYPGDRHARSIMFEAMGIVGKSKQPLVAIQQNINVGSEQASRVGFTQKLLAAGRK